MGADCDDAALRMFCNPTRPGIQRELQETYERIDQAFERLRAARKRVDEILKGSDD